jgi:Protein of unknown function (DUF3592)
MSQEGDAWTLDMREVHDVRGMIARFFCALAGVVCITLGVSLIDINRYLLQHGVRTTGVDVANHRYVYKGSVTYAPQVRYVVPGNHTYMVEGESGPEPQFRVGESVTVSYDPLHPETALVVAATSDDVAWFFIIAGCVFFVLAIPLPLLWLLLRRRPTTGSPGKARQASAR